MDTAQLQTEVNKVFQAAFGRTPLRGRLDDIAREARELDRFTDLLNLKEEAGDLLASLLQLMNEADWNAEEVVLATLEKIRQRKDQYHSLGRKFNVAIFGGAFDPVTLGHLDVAQLVLDTSRTFDEVWFMPCYQHMHGKQMESAAHRYAMCQLAAQYDGRIKVSDYEIHHKLAGETYNLVKRLLADEQYSERYNFSFVLGQDQANSYHTWVNYDELERLIRHVVVPRDGCNPDLNNPWYLKSPHIYLRNEKPPRSTSSTQVRNCYAELALADGVEPEWDAVTARLATLVLPEVDHYIKRHHLYGLAEIE